MIAKRNTNPGKCLMLLQCFSKETSKTSSHSPGPLKKNVSRKILLKSLFNATRCACKLCFMIGLL